MSETMTVRVPSKLREEAERLVKMGYFKSLSEAMVSGLRKEVVEHRPSKATLLLRKIEEKQWAEYMKKAGGDQDKAVDLYLLDLDKTARKYGF